MMMAGSGDKTAAVIRRRGGYDRQRDVRPIVRLAIVWGAAAPSAARDTHRIARARFANNAP